MKRLKGANEMNDKLFTIFELQKKFNKSVGVDTDEISKDEQSQQQWILNYCRAVQQEVSELVDCCKWKWWASYQSFDKQNSRVEVVDLVHFVISLAQVLGMTPDDLYQSYLKKNEINFKRQENGYSVKDNNDCKGI